MTSDKTVRNAQYAVDAITAELSVTGWPAHFHESTRVAFASSGVDARPVFYLVSRFYSPDLPPGARFVGASINTGPGTTLADIRAAVVPIVAEALGLDAADLLVTRDDS